MNKIIKPTLELKKVCKTFVQGTQKLEVLKNVDLQIKSGEIKHEQISCIPNKRDRNN